MELFKISTENVSSYASLGFNLQGLIQNEVFPLAFETPPKPGFGLSWSDLRCVSQYLLTAGDEREDRVN